MTLSDRARARMEQEAADDSTSGVIPLSGLAALTFLFVAFLRLIF